MLVTFTCNAHGDITMFGNIAEQLIKMMGHSGTIPSAIRAEDIPKAIDTLKKALESHREILSEDFKPRDLDDEEEQPNVNLANRAFPLFEMLEAAVKEDCPVMWREA